jgi:uncharacterized protein
MIISTQHIVVVLLTAILSIAGCTSVVNKIAFHPDKKNNISSKNLPSGVKNVFFVTKDKKKLHGFLLRNLDSKILLIYFHGNSGNISNRLGQLLTLKNMGINVLGVSYRGYGLSEGEPSEAGLYIDGKTALNYAQHLGFKLENIIIFGRSIGTTVAINTCQNRKIRSLILVTPLISAKMLGKAKGLGSSASVAGSAFNNIGKTSNIICPVLVIHGTKDNVIPYVHGKEIFKALKTQKQFISINGANHNNLSTLYGTSYWPAIKSFITANTSN